MTGSLSNYYKVDNCVKESRMAFGYKFFIWNIVKFVRVWELAVAGLGQGPNFNMSNQIWVNGSVNLSLEYGRKTLPHNLLSTTTARQRAALEDGDQSNIFLLSIHCITTVIATVCNSYSKIVKLEIVFLYFIYSMLDVGLKQLKTMIGVGSSSSM